MTTAYLTKGVLIGSLIISCSCSRKSVAVATPNQVPISEATSLSSIKYTVEDAPEWTALFNRNKGWFGADGIFAIPLNANDQPGAAADSESIILFSDTMIGDIIEGKLQPGYSMIHNSVATIKGTDPKDEKVQFHWAEKANGESESIFIPNTPRTEKGDYYWLGDGFVNTELGDNVYIFGYRVRDIKTANAFGFEQVGNTLIVLPRGSKPPFKDQKQLDVPLFVSGGTPDNYISFGSAVFVNTAKAGMSNPDGYVYVYGIRGKEKGVIVARVLPKEFEQFDKWRYWDGKSWNTDINKVANVTDRASNELSLTPLSDGRYALVFQTDGIGTTVGMRIGQTPVGPFGQIINLWDCKDAIVEKDFITYNAKAHPSLSKPGELLVSYNVNSFDFFNDIKVYPNLYRPRFFKIKF